jgi:hypothetical protein
MIVIAISAMTLTLQKSFQRCQCQRWNPHDSAMKNFIRMSALQFFWRISAVSITPRKWLWQLGVNHFSGGIDTDEIYMTLLKFQNDFGSPYLLLKRTSSKNILWVNISILYKYFRQKLHFRFHQCHLHRWNWCWWLSKRLTQRIRSHTK